MENTKLTDREKIRQVLDETIKIKCPICKGSGTKHKRSGGVLVLVACDTCKGKGQVSKTLKQHFAKLHKEWLDQSRRILRR